jgi:hypothetical protein
MGTIHGYKSVPIPCPYRYGTRGYPYPLVKLPSLPTYPDHLFNYGSESTILAPHLNFSLLWANVVNPVSFLEVNLNKSKLVPIRCKVEDVDDLLQIFQCRTALVPIKYQGMPLLCRLFEKQGNRFAIFVNREEV